jgi:hypothetical protein
MQIGFDVVLGVLVAAPLLVIVLFCALNRVERLRLARLRPGDPVEILTPDGRVLHGLLVTREALHFWVDLEPGDARLRVPANWVSAARRRAPRRSRGGETGSPPLRVVSARRAAR